MKNSQYSKRSIISNTDIFSNYLKWWWCKRRLEFNLWRILKYSLNTADAEKSWKAKKQKKKFPNHVSGMQSESYITDYEICPHVILLSFGKINSLSNCTRVYLFNS